MSKAKPISKWFSEFVPLEVQDSTVFNFSIRIGDRNIDLDLRSDLGIDYGALQQHLEDTPSEYAFWGAMYSELKAQCAVLERKIKARRGYLADHLIKESYSHQVKLTDKQLTSTMEGDDELNKMELLMTRLQKQTGKVYFIVEAIKIKSDNLRSLAGFAKIEFQQSGDKQ